MKLLGNIIWIIFGGFFEAIFWFLLGIFWCITIIGIPFGTQCFKIGVLYFAPFGTKVDTKFDEHPIANIIWIILGGLEMAISHVIIGILFCITIIGIPFGKQWFKLAKLSLIPFGATLQ